MLQRHIMQERLRYPELAPEGVAALRTLEHYLNAVSGLEAHACLSSSASAPPSSTAASTASPPTPQSFHKHQRARHPRRSRRALAPERGLHRARARRPPLDRRPSPTSSRAMPPTTTTPRSSSTSPASELVNLTLAHRKHQRLEPPGHRLSLRNGRAAPSLTNISQTSRTR